MNKKSDRTQQAYFDCNATTPVLPVAVQAALQAMETLYGNPSSSHGVGLQAKEILESSRIVASQVVGADPSEIIFTSGATEAIQTAVFSTLQSIIALTAKENNKPSFQPGSEGEVLPRPNKLLYGATEHKAVPMALRYWVKMLNLSLEIVELPVDQNGQICLEVLKKELPRAALVCTMAVNNEVGTIQNLAAIEKLLLDTGSKALWLVDCVQALGKLSLNLRQSRIDYAPFSGHKLYAPKGIGFLYVRKGAPFFPLIVGGGQENGFRSGTENLPGVAALGAVLKELQKKSMDGPSCFQSESEQLRFRDQLLAELKRAFPSVLFNTPLDYSVPTSINFSVPGFKSAELLSIFDAAGLRLSAGSACSASSAKPSHVLDAMGFPEWRSASALRLSFGPCTLEDEIQLGCELIRKSAAVLQQNCLLEIPSDSPQALVDGIIQFASGHSNCWLIVDAETRSCIIIDPTEPVAARIESFIRCQNLAVLAILDTHTHADHESARPLLQKTLQDKIKKEASPLNSLGWPKGSSELVIKKNQRGEFVLSRLETPGHSIDSVSYLLGYKKSAKLAKNEVEFVFSGDLILSGSLGRSNYSGSQPAVLYETLKNLVTQIDPYSVICPAHDYDTSYGTTLEAEFRKNPLLAGVITDLFDQSPEHQSKSRPKPLALKAFIERKSQLDRDLLGIEKTLGEVICGTASPCESGSSESYQLTFQEFKELNARSQKGVLVVDVRESAEHALSKNWDALGFQEPPLNIPISRFVNWIRQSLQSDRLGRDIVFICRAGGRSLSAAETARRLGLEHTYSLKGGIALL